MKSSFCTIIVDLNEEHTAFSQRVAHNFETSRFQQVGKGEEGSGRRVDEHVHPFHLLP